MNPSPRPLGGRRGRPKPRVLAGHLSQTGFRSAHEDQVLQMGGVCKVKKKKTSFLWEQGRLKRRIVECICGIMTLGPSDNPFPSFKEGVDMEQR